MKAHNRSESASLPAFSWTRLSNLHKQTPLPFWCVSSISTLWSSLAQTLSIFIDFYFVPSAAHYILYLMPVGNVYFSVVTEMSECLCTVYVLLCISAVPKHGGDLEKQIQAQH